MNICLIGCGAIAEKHMEALSAIEGVHPRLVVGRRQAQASDFAGRWRFDGFTLSLEEALRDRSIDAVLVASPNALHAEQAERALIAGKHTLVEIPMALNLRDAERITALAKRTDRRLMIAHTMRYFPGMREVWRRVTTGGLRIRHMVGFFGLLRRTDTTSSGVPRSWTDDLLWHFSAHMVDIALWTTRHRGCRSVSCHFGPRHDRQGVLDLTLSMSLPGGELVTLAQSFNVSQFRWRLTFVGQEGTLDFDNGTLRDDQGRVIVPYSSVVDLHEQDREFIASIREERDPAITGEEVLPAMRILDEAQRDAQGR